MRKPLVRKSMKNITKIENKSTTVLIQGIQERLSFEKSMTYQKRGTKKASVMFKCHIFKQRYLKK